MDTSMDATSDEEVKIKPSPESHSTLLSPDEIPQNARSASACSVPASALPQHLTQNYEFSNFISPSKEGELPMDFSPAAKKGNGQRSLRLEFKSPLAKSPDGLAKGKAALSQSSLDEDSSAGEMSPSQVFSTRPGSPSAQFKAMLDDIDVAGNADYTKEEEFLRRQEKPSIRRCRSLEMRKRLFDVSNTPPNAYTRSVFKRPADVDSKHSKYTKTKAFKRPNTLSILKESSPPSGSQLTGGSEHLGSPPSPTSDGETSSHDSAEEHSRIKDAVDTLQSPDIVGDCSRQFCLPLIPGKHSDLKNISHHTMKDLLTDLYKDKYKKRTIIDCRYPYEYKGGHIKGAVNIYTEEEIVTFLKKEVSNDCKPHILVFHCEFSSQRGPGLLRHLRKLDRELNLSQYPSLTFPEIYCLHGGYKEFFLHYPEFCEPSAYVPMSDENHAHDLRHFRAKAKSWTAGEKARSLKKF